jgi:hypothetical protein
MGGRTIPLGRAGGLASSGPEVLHQAKGYVLAKAGRTSEARIVLEALTARARERYVPMYTVAIVHAGLGDRDALFAALEAAYAAHDVHLVFLPVDAKWDPYRTDPRFTSLLARCGFMQQRGS